MVIVYVSRQVGCRAGTIGAYICNMAKCMSRRGHQIYLVTDELPNDYSRDDLENIKIVKTIPNHHKKEFISQVHEYADRVYHTLKRLCSSVHVDLIEFADKSAEGFVTIRAKELLNEFSKTKLVVKIHSSIETIDKVGDCRQTNFEKYIQRFAEKYSISHAELVTVPLDFLSHYIKDEVDLTKIRYSPYPLPYIEPNHHFDSQRSHKIVFVGSLQPAKGLDLFLEAAKSLIEQCDLFTFDIYGQDTSLDLFSNSYQNYIENKIPNHLKENIHFKGFVEQDELLDAFRNAGFCILPSRWDGCTYSGLEAMSAGCIAIISKYGGISEIIEHGFNGFKVDPFNIDEIVSIVIENFSSSGYLQQISMNAHATVEENFNSDLACKYTEASYRSIINERKVVSRNNVTNPKVSVIIPLYNQGRYIQESIDSVKASTYKNIEIIVVNDGSTDCETNCIFENLRNVRKIRKANGGLSSARNTGILASTGDFILPLDADDKIHHEYIEKAVTALTQHKCLSYITCYANNFGAFDSIYTAVGFIPELMLFMPTDGKYANVYRKEAVLAIDGYDEDMIAFEDWEFIIRMNKHGFHGDVLPEEMYYYRRHSDSMNYRFAIQKRSDLIQFILNKHQDLLEKYYKDIILNLVYLWKNNIEVSKSAQQVKA